MSGEVYWKLCSDRECKRMHADPDLVSLSSRSPHDPNIGPTDMPPPYDAEAIITKARAELRLLTS